MKRQVVLTGYGIICALGNNKKEVKHAFFNLEQKFGPLSSIGDYGELGNVMVGMVNTERKTLKHAADFDMSECFCRLALNEALADAGMTVSDIGHMGERVSISLSTSVMGADHIVKYVEEDRKNGAWLVNSKAYAWKFAKEYQVNGACYTTSSACASGTAGMGIAFDLIRNDKADVVIVGGTDHITDISLYGFKALDTLSEEICKPFDSNRDGINIGEGSAFFIFENIEHAKSRAAFIYGEVLGYGLSNDAYHITSPDPLGKGAYRSMSMALQEAGRKLDGSFYINAHGTGTKANDEMEVKAIDELDCEEQIHMSSTKSLTGHCLGAAGSIECALSLMVLEEGRCPKTANSEFDIVNRLKVTDREAKSSGIHLFLSNSFAFGGNGASIVITNKIQERNQRHVS